MGTHDRSKKPNGGKEDARRQRQRTIGLYESLLDRAREVAHDAEERMHRVMDDEQPSADDDAKRD
jgi:hypothetical protein